MQKKHSTFNILIVDDEPLIRRSLYEILRIEGYQAHMAETAEEAISLMNGIHMDIVITDMMLPKMNGIELLSAIKQAHPDTEVILATGFGSIETAVEAMKKGAYDYITKPIIDSEIKIIINKVLQQKQLLQENKELKQFIAKTGRSSFCGMIGASEKLQKVYNIIESVASSNATIMITGESGTGKGLVARAIHDSDQNRRDKPFVEVSCGALSETLLESELFGHVKGAFTGAIKDKEGRFEFANGGTIFLDEIDAFSLNLQVKLLRVLQDGVFERVGENKTRTTDARIIVATNQNLADLVTKGRFREDLYYRINVIAIEIPPLRERRDDVERLMKYFVDIYSKKNHKAIKGFSDEVKNLLCDYRWPGNIRELENAIEGAVIMAKDDIIRRENVPNFEKFSASTVRLLDEKPLKKALEAPERDHIIAILNNCNWNRNKAAAALGVNRTTLYNKMKRFKIPFKRMNHDE